MKKILLLSLAFLLTIKVFAQNGPSDETPINYKNLSGNIIGTLSLPKNVSGKVPVVLIVADSGPTDRNGNNEQTGLNSNMYKLLAEGLAKNGIASVRFDKRMVGESKTANKLEDLRFDDYVDDAVGLIGMLNDDQRFSKVVILGHGEGSLVAMLAARDQPAKAIISINATSEQGDKLMTQQFKSKPQYIQDEFKTLLDSMKKGKTFDNVDLAMYPLVTTAKQKYLLSYFRYPPLRVIKVMKVPVLIVQGTTDVQNSVADAEKLKKAKSDAVLITIKGMNHIMKEAPADKDQNMATYSNPALPLKAELVPDLVDFINKN
jgi:pimeloyl-ACP methyl ester carboxylesterase